PAGGSWDRRRRPAAGAPPSRQQEGVARSSRVGLPLLTSTGHGQHLPAAVPIALLWMGVPRGDPRTFGPPPWGGRARRFAPSLSRAVARRSAHCEDERCC